jgi:hypothetical protein
MDKENIYIHNLVLFSHKKEWNYVICRKIDGTVEYYVKQNYPGSERQILHVLSHMLNLEIKNVKYDINSKGEVWGSQWKDKCDGEKNINKEHYVHVWK